MAQKISREEMLRKVIEEKPRIEFGKKSMFEIYQMLNDPQNSGFLFSQREDLVCIEGITPVV